MVNKLTNTTASPDHFRDQFIVLPYRSENFEGVIKLWHAVRQNSPDDFKADYCETQLAGYFSKVIVPKDNIWVALIQDQVIGFMTIRGDYLSNIFVAKPYQLRGVGRALLRQVFSQNPAKLWLHTAMGNNAAHRFFKQHGFVQTNTEVSPKSGAQYAIYELINGSEDTLNTTGNKSYVDQTRD
jgi:putative acetyltransferase